MTSSPCMRACSNRAAAPRSTSTCPPRPWPTRGRIRSGAGRQAQAVGPHCHELIEALYAHRVLGNLRAAQGVVRLGTSYGARRLEAACARALAFDSVLYSHRQNHPRKGGRPGASAEGGRSPAQCTLHRARPFLPRHRTLAEQPTLQRIGDHSMTTTSAKQPMPELAPLLKRLRLSGILESLPERNREALEAKLSHTEFPGAAHSGRGCAS